MLAGIGRGGQDDRPRGESLSLLLLPPLMRNRGVLAASASIPFAGSPPRNSHGGDPSKNKPRAERSDHLQATDKRLPCTNMDVWAWQLPVADQHQGWEGRRSRSRSDGTPGQPDPAKPGDAQKCIQMASESAGDSSRTHCADYVREERYAGRNGTSGAGSGYASAAICSRLASNWRICS
jgi:hypothetical protein